MRTSPNTSTYGITRTGSAGSYSYSAIAGLEYMPVNYVSIFDALRFANWLNNGKGAGDTESGAYTLLGGTATPSNGSSVTRNPGATIALASENEWYKAAYYNASTASYFDYPTGTDTQTGCSTSTATVNRANCSNAVGDLTKRGSYPLSASPYGTFDQGGNVFEWNESIFGTFSGIRGGGFLDDPTVLGAANGFVTDSTTEDFDLGFRVVPEPSGLWQLLAGVAALVALKRRRDRRHWI